MTTKTTQSEFDVDRDGYFGVCPECGKTDGYLNVGPDHWFVCDAHKTKWHIGSNLFSSWRDETEASRQAAEKLLDGYRQIEPLPAASPF